MSQSGKKNYSTKQIISSPALGSYTTINSRSYIFDSDKGGSKFTRRRQNSNSNLREQPLQWEAATKSILYKNGSDVEDLLTHKNILLDLIRQFEGKDTVVIEGRQRDDFSKRLLLLQAQIEGLMRRKILIQSPESAVEGRQLDYTLLLNEKENQVNALERKVQNLEGRVKKMQARQIQLQNQITFLNEQLKRKNEIIEHKDNAFSQQFAYGQEMASTLQQIKKPNSNYNFSNISNHITSTFDLADMRSSAKKVADSGSLNSEAVKLIRQFQSAGNKQGSKPNSEAIVEGWILGLPKDSLLRTKLMEGQKKSNQDKKYAEMEEKFALASQIYQNQLQKIRSQNPDLKIDGNQQIFSLLKSPKSSAIRVGNVVQIQNNVEKTIEVPVQDKKTKNLIQLLTSNYKKLFAKYPKLYNDIDSRLAEYFSQEMIDVADADELDKVVSVVKYVPQVVKVQNVYAYSDQKPRKTEFHLRVLIKALLDEMEKAKENSGIAPEIDEGVIRMVRKQINDIVDVQDILKIYRCPPKIVEVEKIVERIVEKVVQVPKIVQVERRVETPVEVSKFKVVENTVNVPIQVPKLQTLIVQKLIEVPKILQRVVEVPRYIQKLVQVIKQVPKVVQVERIVQKPIQVERYRQIEKQIIVPLIQYRNVELVKEKIVETRQIIQKSVPVDRIIQKIVEVRVEVPKIIEVQTVVQKIIQKIQYIPAPDIRNHIEIRYEPVDRVIEKIVPVIQKVQEIIEVPKVVEKIVQVHDVIEKLVEVQFVVEKPIYIDRLKEVEKIVGVPVVEYKIQQKIIEKIVQVPLIHEVIKIQKQIVQVPIVEIVEKIVHKQIQIEKPKILYQDRVKEVEKIINHFVKQPQIIRMVEEKITVVEKVVQKIKTVPTVIQKLIEKLVEVPKVVEVQKIVEKIVVVPRIIEKLVEIPQIVEKIVEKIITIPKIVEIEKIVNAPVFQQRIVEVEMPCNVYLQVERPVAVVRQVLVRDEIYKQNAKIHELVSQKVVVQTRQVPKTLEIEKIISHIVKQPKIIEINRDVLIPIQIQIPVDKVIQKIVPIQHFHKQIEQVDKIVERIVPVKQESIKVVEVQKLVDNIIIEQRIKEVEKIVPYIQQKVVEVQRLKEKIVPIEKVVQQIKEVKQIVQKVVDRVSEIPKVYEVQKLVQKRVDVSKIIQVQKLVHQIIHVNKYIQNIVEKIIEIPVLIQQLREIQVEKEKIVQVKIQTTNIQQVDRAVEKEVIVQKLKHVTNNIHLIEQTLKIVDKIVQKNLDPILVTQEKIIQVPKIVEKIVSKIVVMPQIVEVLKYIHQITEQPSLGHAVSKEIGEQEIKYKDIANNLKNQLDDMLSELIKLKSLNPSVKQKIELIEKFLNEFQRFILYPRIHEIIGDGKVQKIIEKDCAVLVPVESESNLRLQLSKTLLIEKLISQLKNLKKQNPNLKLKNLDDDINLIFFSQIGDPDKFSGEQFNEQLNDFSNSVQNKFSEMGGWTRDHQLMLNSFLQQRFLLANVLKNSNESIKKTKAISQKRLQQLRKVKEQRDSATANLKNLQQILTGILLQAQKQKNKNLQTQILSVLKSIKITSSKLISEIVKGDQPQPLDQVIMDSRIQSLIRQKDDTINQLKCKLVKQNTQTTIKESNYFQNRLKDVTIQRSRIQSNHSKCIEQKNRWMEEKNKWIEQKSKYQEQKNQYQQYKSKYQEQKRKWADEKKRWAEQRARYIEQIQRLKSRIKQLELQIQRAKMTSLKESINTRNTITTPPYEKKIQTNVGVLRRNEKLETDSEGYGKSYRNYGIYDEDHKIESEENVFKSSHQKGSGSVNTKYSAFAYGGESVPVKYEIDQLPITKNQHSNVEMKYEFSDSNKGPMASFAYGSESVPARNEFGLNQLKQSGSTKIQHSYFESKEENGNHFMKSPMISFAYKGDSDPARYEIGLDQIRSVGSSKSHYTKIKRKYQVSSSRNSSNPKEKN